jgi:Zn-dependent M28 family amino/carboxypeptidase
MSWLHEDGEPESPRGVPLRGLLHHSAFERLLARAGYKGGLAALEQQAKANALKGFALDATAHGKLRTSFRELKSHNVVGALRGSDPRLRDEYVIYSAHLDHLGFAEPIDGDSLYNGALDNGSGVASLLELARAFAALPQRPARSILFCFVTGEERGLLGSEYFARHPTIPAASMVANLNVDMLMSLRPLHDVIALGIEHSTLERHVREAASALGVALSPDPQPRLVSFIRSDQYSFVRRGVPAVVVRPGLKDAAGDTAQGLAAFRDWIKNRYHSPKDEWDPRYDYEAMAGVVRLNLLVGLSVARAPERPRWHPGDFFARFRSRISPHAGQMSVYVDVDGDGGDEAKQTILSDTLLQAYRPSNAPRCLAF